MGIGKSLTKEQRQERLRLVDEMRNDDRSDAYISRKLGITRQALSKFLKRHQPVQESEGS